MKLEKLICPACGAGIDMDIKGRSSVFCPFCGSQFTIDDGTSMNIVAAIREAFADMNMPQGDTVIPVYIGGNMLDEIVVTAQQRVNLRSGGR